MAFGPIGGLGGGGFCTPQAAALAALVDALLQEPLAHGRPGDLEVARPVERAHREHRLLQQVAVLQRDGCVRLRWPTFVMRCMVQKVQGTSAD